MSNDVNNLTLRELLDLSPLEQTEIIRLQAEAARAEYVSQLVTKASRKIKALFTTKKAEINASGMHHA